MRERLADLPPPNAPPVVVPGSRPAAVLVPLFEEDGEAHVILTKRPETMPSHQGEIVFPGGTVQPDVDRSACEAALREAHEEIGLPPELVDVVGELNALATIATRFTITPFVGLLGARPVLQPDQREVARVFDVPLSELLTNDAFREERWDFEMPGFPEGRDRPMYFYDLSGETIWGATARMLTDLLRHLTGT